MPQATCRHNTATKVIQGENKISPAIRVYETCTHFQCINGMAPFALGSQISLNLGERGLIRHWNALHHRCACTMFKVVITITFTSFPL